VSTEPLKSEYLIIVNRRRLGRWPGTSLSINRDLDPDDYVKVLRSTLVMLYRARAPLSSAVS